MPVQVFHHIEIAAMPNLCQIKSILSFSLLKRLFLFSERLWTWFKLKSTLFVKVRRKFVFSVNFFCDTINQFESFFPFTWNLLEYLNSNGLHIFFFIIIIILEYKRNNNIRVGGGGEIIFYILDLFSFY